jgi:hypothetical protein
VVDQAGSFPLEASLEQVKPCDEGMDPWVVAPVNCCVHPALKPHIHLDSRKWASSKDLCGVSMAVLMSRMSAEALTTSQVWKEPFKPAHFRDCARLQARSGTRRV